MCVHVGFLALAGPRFLGNEFDFAAEVIRSATRRPAGFAAPVIDVHTQGPGDRDGLAGVTDHLLRQLRPLRTGGARVRLFLWPKLLDRVLLAGDVAGGGGGPDVSLRPR